MTDATGLHAHRRTEALLRQVLVLVLVVLVLMGLASSGLTPPERADARPLVSQDVQQASASRRASSHPAAQVSARRIIVAAISAPAMVMAPPVVLRTHPRQESDPWLSRLRLRPEIRGPPGGLSA